MITYETIAIKVEFTLSSETANVDLYTPNSTYILGGTDQRPQLGNYGVPLYFSGNAYGQSFNNIIVTGPFSPDYKGPFLDYTYLGKLNFGQTDSNFAYYVNSGGNGLRGSQTNYYLNGKIVEFHEGSSQVGDKGAILDHPTSNTLTQADGSTSTTPHNDKYYSYVWTAAYVPVEVSGEIKASLTGQANVIEGDTIINNSNYHVSLDRPAPIPITVFYSSSDGTARSGTDYEPVAKSITIPTGQSGADFQVAIKPNYKVDGQRDFSVHLDSASAQSAGYNISLNASNSTVTTNIIDGTLPPSALTALGAVKNVFSGSNALLNYLVSAQAANPVVASDFAILKNTVGKNVTAIGFGISAVDPLLKFNSDIDAVSNISDQLARDQKEWLAYRDLDVSIGNNAYKVAFVTLATTYLAEAGVVAGAELYLAGYVAAGGFLLAPPAFAAAALGIAAGYGLSIIYDNYISPSVKEFLSNNYENSIPAPTAQIVPIPGQSSNSDPAVPGGGVDNGGVQVSAAGLIVHDVSSASGNVFALYEGLLGHAPDTAGGQSWVAALNAGTSLHDVTAAILSSPEAQARISASDNATYVDQLYEMVLGRQVDTASAHSWVAALDAGTASRADVANALVFSEENVAQLQPVLSKGVPVLDPGLASAERLYEALLHRDPDQTGLQNISDALAHGGTLQDVAHGILTSSEYLSAHPQMSDGQYVEALYQGLLERAGDAGSANSWVAALSNGTDRASVANAFLDSAEFQGHYANQGSAAYVDALYQHVFGHAGDASAVQSLASQLDAHSVSRIDVANSFTSSAEFQAHYPGSGDAGFVESLYHDALGRVPDAAGEASWVYALSHGTSRADVALAIVDSPEAQQHLAAQVGAGLHVA